MHTNSSSLPSYQYPTAFLAGDFHILEKLIIRCDDGLSLCGQHTRQSDFSARALHQRCDRRRQVHEWVSQDVCGAQVVHRPVQLIGQCFYQSHISLSLHGAQYDAQRLRIQRVGIWQVIRHLYTVLPCVVIGDVYCIGIYLDSHGGDGLASIGGLLLVARSCRSVVVIANDGRGGDAQHSRPGSVIQEMQSLVNVHSPFNPVPNPIQAQSGGRMLPRPERYPALQSDLNVFPVAVIVRCHIIMVAIHVLEVHHRALPLHPARELPRHRLPHPLALRLLTRPHDHRIVVPRKPQYELPLPQNDGSPRFLDVRYPIPIGHVVDFVPGSGGTVEGVSHGVDDGGNVERGGEVCGDVASFPEVASRRQVGYDHGPLFAQFSIAQ
mmetsp:Transcript_25315/g.60840  ORF Transcript_25315/g.60840 Transcript_25315/m.60840 type:complete len:380 (-) Transcript_25315:756-1895(-)